MGKQLFIVLLSLSLAISPVLAGPELWSVPVQIVGKKYTKGWKELKYNTLNGRWEEWVYPQSFRVSLSNGQTVVVSYDFFVKLKVGQTCLVTESGQILTSDEIR